MTCLEVLVRVWGVGSPQVASLLHFFGACAAGRRHCAPPDALSIPRPGGIALPPDARGTGKGPTAAARTRPGAHGDGEEHSDKIK